MEDVKNKYRELAQRIYDSIQLDSLTEEEEDFLEDIVKEFELNVQGIPNEDISYLEGYISDGSLSESNSINPFISKKSRNFYFLLERLFNCVKKLIKYFIS